jgi:hypothetical protein
MDLDQLKNLSPEQKERYAQLERTFATPGWRLIVEGLKARHMEATERQLVAKTWEETCALRGVRDALGFVVSTEQFVDAEFAALALPKDAEVTQDELDHE